MSDSFSESEIQIGSNRYRKWIIVTNLTANTWAYVNTLPNPSNAIINSGLSFVQAENAFRYPLDFNLTGISCRINYNTGMIQAYSIPETIYSNIYLCVEYSK